MSDVEPALQDSISFDSFGHTLASVPGFNPVILDSDEIVHGADFGNYSEDDGVISGTAWEDLDADGALDDGEPGLEGWTVYLDENSDGVLDPGERSKRTGAGGRYTFTGLAAGTYAIREQVRFGWEQSFPVAESHTLTLTSGETQDSINFGNVFSLVAAVIDNGDPGYAHNGLTTYDHPRAYQGDLCYRLFSATAEDWATWTFADLAAGAYEVQVTWLGGHAGATDAPYEILDGAMSEGTVRLDQTVDPDDVQWDGHWWETLGTYEISEGALTVRLSGDANGIVGADAVRVVSAAMDALPPTMARQGTQTVDGTWEPTPVAMVMITDTVLLDRAASGRRGRSTA